MKTDPQGQVSEPLNPDTQVPENMTTAGDLNDKPPVDAPKPTARAVSPVTAEGSVIKRTPVTVTEADVADIVRAQSEGKSFPPVPEQQISDEGRKAIEDAAELDRIALEVETGSQDWRKDVADRWAAHLDSRAGLEAGLAMKAREAGDLDATEKHEAAQREFMAAADRVRKGDLGMSDVNAEIALRVAAGQPVVA